MATELSFREGSVIYLDAAKPRRNHIQFRTGSRDLVNHGERVPSARPSCRQVLANLFVVDMALSLLEAQGDERIDAHGGNHHGDTASVRL
jgi:hypothetical protein